MNSQQKNSGCLGRSSIRRKKIDFCEKKMVVNSIKLLFKDLIGWRNSVNKSDFKEKIFSKFFKRNFGGL